MGSTDRQNCAAVPMPLWDFAQPGVIVRVRCDVPRRLSRKTRRCSPTGSGESGLFGRCAQEEVAHRAARDVAGRQGDHTHGDSEAVRYAF
jgi:hypothetical protein